MKAIITNITQEGERIRVFVSFDGLEKSFLLPLEATKDEIVSTIEAEKARLAEVASVIDTLKDELVNIEI